MKRFRPRLVPGIFFLIALTILLALGTWQVKRLQWKNHLIETIASRVNLPTRPLPPLNTWKQLDLGQWIYRVVKARGKFDPEKQVHIFTQVGPEQGGYNVAGYWVVVPFYLECGGVVLVNRGFIPEKFKQQRLPPYPNTGGQQTIIGIVKTNQGRNYFTPENDYRNNIWFTRDIKAISSYFKLENAAPFLIALTKGNGTGPLPQPREAKVTLSNNHLGYAITWYGLAFTLIGVFVVFSLKSDPVPGKEANSIK